MGITNRTVLLPRLDYKNVENRTQGQDSHTFFLSTLKRFAKRKGPFLSGCLAFRSDKSSSHRFSKLINKRFAILLPYGAITKVSFKVKQSIKAKGRKTEKEIESANQACWIGQLQRLSTDWVLDNELCDLGKAKQLQWLL